MNQLRTTNSFRALPQRKTGESTGIDAETKANLRMEEKTHQTKMHVISKGTDAAFQVVTTALAVWQLEREADEKIRVIAAETEALKVRFSGELAVLQAEVLTLQTKGNIAVQLTEALLQDLDMIPDLDTESRKAFMEALPKIIQSATGA